MKTKLTLAINGKSAFLISDFYGDPRKWELRPVKPYGTRGKRPTLEESQIMARRIVAVFQAIEVLTN